MIKTEITGIGYYVPEQVITNKDLEQKMDTTNEWIVSRSGIQERHWVRNGMCTSDLAFEASKKAMEAANVSPKEIDLVIVGTISSDYFFPGVSAQLQDLLGLNNVGAFDIKAACSAFVYTLSIGDQFIRSGMYDTILIVGAEVQSRYLNISSEGRDIAVLFGDGAGAAILQKSDGKRGILSTHLHCQGANLKNLWMEAPGSSENCQITTIRLEEGRHFPSMNGREVFRHAVLRFPEVIQESLDSNGLTLDDVALIIPHQANLRISQAVAKRLGVGMDKVFSNIHKYGNTTAASIPIAFCEAIEEKRISKGDIVILASFGAGFTWASAAIRW